MKTHRIGPETNRLVLRAMASQDAEAFCALNSSPEVMRFTGEPPVESVDEARTLLEAYPDFDRFGFGRWGCVLKKTHQLIGFCGLKYLDDLDEVDIGYRFLPKYWGRGLATEACVACVRFGFEVLKLNRIIGLVMAQNHASRRVLEKAGFQLEGDMLIYGHRALQYDIER